MIEPNVQVSILNSEEIKFELHGNYNINGTDQVLSGKFFGKLKGKSIVISDGEKEFESPVELELVPDDYESDSILIRDVIIGINFHWEQKENQRFKGSLKLLLNENKINAINILTVEDYLTSVISSEMSATSSAELLKAHAIISRSWLLAQIEGKDNPIKLADNKIENDEERITWYDREDHETFDVCADDHCQRYQGITKLHAHNAQDAVAFTKGLVVKYEDKICDTRFSKSCGGVSESFENVWEPEVHPYLSSVVDYKFAQEEAVTDLTDEKAAEKWIESNPPAFCNTSDKAVLSQVLMEYDQKTADFYRWRVEYTQKQISKLLKEKTGIDFGAIVDLIPIERGYSGRLVKLKIVGEKKTLTIGKELEIRRSLSKSHLYSSAFTIKKTEDENGVPKSFILNGAGWGHGVGLCQIGAAVMSEMGYQFDEILLHYFKNAKIEKIY